MAGPSPNMIQDIPDQENGSLTILSADVHFMVFPNGNTKPNTHPNGRAESVKDVAAASSRRIGEMVRQRRLANRLTQRQLGELAGVGLRLVSELERGKATLRMDAVNRVLAVFGLMLGPVEAPRSEEGES